jgi:transcriptional regulator with XRE-family HTH domain
MPYALVQSCTVIPIRELRRALGLNQTQFGRRIGVHKNSVINWERGHSRPTRASLLRIRAVARWHRLQSEHSQSLPTKAYDPNKMRYYLGKPGSRWHTMTGQQRSSYLANRAKYKQLQADISAGRVLACPRIK